MKGQIDKHKGKVNRGEERQKERSCWKQQPLLGGTGSYNVFFMVTCGMPSSRNTSETVL